MKAKYQKLANEFVVSLFPAFNLPLGMLSGTKRLLNCRVYIPFKIENGACEWYFIPENWKQAHLSLTAKIRKNPKFLSFAYDQMISLARRQIEFGKSLGKSVTTASNRQLVKFYNQFIVYNIELYEYGLLLPLLDYNELTFLSDELHKILKEKKADKYFNLLTIPKEQTTVKKQELDLLLVLGEILRQESLKMLFKEETVEHIEGILSKRYPRIWKKIQNHTKKYAWAYYVYEGPAVREQYFLEILKDWVKNKTNPASQLRQYSQFAQDIDRKQQKAIKKLRLNKYEAEILHLTRLGVFIKPFRRELQSCSYYYIEPLLAEIARRLQMSLKQVRMLLPDEIEGALMKNKDYLDKINERQKLLFYSCWPKQICLSGNRAKNYIRQNVIQEKLNLEVTTFTGTTAFAGKVSGRIKIINMPEEMGKMKPGDILVALTTNPNLMPAIRIAKAIVTEEGGLTCHAAIVSRELRIPCVVGAKPIARALKDGDKVEVDATKGIVKKL
jgi:phosphoenolpyruvate synthase/pyruvate phosphate dikinase